MVSDSKILTVSYGTFSCTLEGFDDPFSTMRGIAEYFRDLAADDRYFGAEPPTPDANMLHSIAEKEINRRVEAKVRDNGIVLRQMDGVSPTSESDGVAQPTDVSDAIADAPKAKKAKRKKVKKPGKPGNTRALQRKAAAKAKAASNVETPLAAMSEDTNLADDADVAQSASVDVQTDAPQTGETVDTPTSDEDAPVTDKTPASIADKLDRIRTAVAHRGPSSYAEDQHATDSFDASQDDTRLEDAPTKLMSETLEETVSEQASETSEEDAKLAAKVKAAQDRRAAKRAHRMRLRAAKRAKAQAAAVAEAAEHVETQENESAEAANDISSLDASADETSVTSVLSAIGDDISTDTSQEARQTEPELGTDEAQAEEPHIDADQSLHDMDPSLAEDIAEASRVPEQTAPETSEQPDPLRQVRARVIKMRRSDLDVVPDQSETSLSDPETETSEFDAAALADEMDIEPQAETADAAAKEDDLAEVLRKELGTSSLDTDAEDELMRELAEVTSSTDVPFEVAADILTEDDDGAQSDAEIESAIRNAQMSDDTMAKNEFRLDDTNADDIENDEDQDDEARNIFSASDESVSRLLDTAEREMGDGENVRRRNAIQHLKAAVAATRAEQAETPENAEAQEEAQADPYREDLARVVRPRRPSETLAQGTRRLAPLMLVSEQRIDEQQDQPSGANVAPVRPRRVSSAALAVKEDEDFTPQADDAIAAPLKNESTDTFADYAETVGAEGLSELLEAAAAYSNFVEGHETVTRPQIMRLASQAMPEELPLEERLRSFGQLLRQGKIRKIKRGRFTVADGTRFKPESAAS